jgi:hypothetical protein
MTSASPFKKIALSLFLLCLTTTIINAQESEGSISAINDFSIKTVEFNPNGIKILALDNTLMLNFKEEVTSLKYEVINNKGKVLLSKQETNGLQESILNITSLENGMYWVRVSSDNVKDFLKFSKTQRVVNRK